MSTSTSTSTKPSALTFDLKARCSTSKARASVLHLPHGPVELPMFMPVATQASLKGLTPEQLEETSCRLCLNNTYHLGLKPGQAVLDTIGGAHKLQGWDHNILTDSGGLVDTPQQIQSDVADFMTSGVKVPDGLTTQVGQNHRGGSEIPQST
ncbi:hypothetical protein LTR46_002341 [Exophiala xenobiotica]|nr:hypothetical protein LTR46_002341 [Exophiala xenobiotica]